MSDQALDELLSLIAPADEATTLNMTVFGPWGVGKTVFAATAPKPLFLDVEKGYISLKNHPELERNSKRMAFKGIKQAELLANKILEGHFSEYKTCVIDTLSSLQQRGLKQQTLAAFAKGQGGRDNAYTPIGKDYQDNTEIMKHIVSLFRDTEMHVIFLCHTKEEKDERTGAISLRPDLTPKLAEKVAEECSIVGYMEREEKNGKVVRSMRLQPVTGITAKNRIGGIPSVITNPNFDMFLNPQNYFDEESD